MIFNIISIAQAAEATTEHSGGIVALFGIKPELLIAQAINFGIVILVLYKWVFKPLGKVLQERQVRIQKSLDDALQIEADKQSTHLETEKLLAAARHQAKAALEQATQRGEQIIAVLTEEANKEKARIIAAAEKEADRAKAEAIASAKDELADIVVTATEKILRHKLDAREDKQLVHDTLREMAK